ncbi:MAG: ribokinase [Subtercola sp.]|nr:ribokinase [Subtercola sp.]
MDVVTKTSDGTRNTTRHPGGSPANVALGLGRLGIQTEFLTSLAPDEFGNTIAQHLRESGVSIAPESFNAERTSSAVATIETAGSASYDFNVVWQIADAPSLPPADIVHTGSIGAFLRPGAEQVRKFVASRSESLVSFDPNIRPSLVGRRSDAREQFERFAAISQLVKLSDEDADWLYPGHDLETVREHLFALGVLLVAVTLGGKGSTLSTPEDSVTIPPISGVRGDTIGAGDSYMAALLAGILNPASGSEHPNRLAGLKRDDLLYLGNLAASAAAITVSRNGADLPNLDDLRQFRLSV